MRNSDGFQKTLNTAPLRVTKSKRIDDKRVLTSGTAGRVLPIAYIPLLREDSLASSKFRIHFEMMETAETLLNAVNVQVNAHFVPYLAFDRFNGMDQLNRSYKGEPETEGGAVIPFIEMVAFGNWGDNDIYQTLGLHANRPVNGAVMEAYNTVVNFRRKQRSRLLTQRARYDPSLATCFWNHTTMRHIKPDFDQAMMDGEVALNVLNAKMPVQGIGWGPFPAALQNDEVIAESDGVQHSYPSVALSTDGSKTFRMKESEQHAGFPDIWAEMQEDGITVSLSNIEMAKKTRAFAKMRKTYAGYDDDYIIDLLMSGIRVPEAVLSQPILMAQQNTIFGYNRRYSTDADALAVSATNGETFIDLNLRLPAMNTGGIIMITAEIVPDQLFERQQDYFLSTADTAAWPEYVRDFLDPEKVAVVKNSHVDVRHTLPDGVFGYAPLNHQWMRDGPNVGGKYLRPPNNQFVEDRQKIWAAETIDPELGEDFYLATSVSNSVFADTNTDPFEISLTGTATIIGNTVFGPTLNESGEDYDAVMAQIDHTRIDKTATTATASEETE